MDLTPREKDKLLISMAAMVARRRLERGVKLNYPEAVALIDFYRKHTAETPETGGLIEKQTDGSAQAAPGAGD